jgi:hypothetical protein
MEKLRYRLLQWFCQEKNIVAQAPVGLAGGRTVIQEEDL